MNTLPYHALHTDTLPLARELKRYSPYDAVRITLKVPTFGATSHGRPK
jgi:hypothetical protein